MKAPRYDADGLAGVLPSVARSLDPVAFAGVGRKLPQARAAIVVLADGLGARLLRRQSAHAPFLREHLERMQTLAAGFPTTTATSRVVLSSSDARWWCLRGVATEATGARG